MTVRPEVVEVLVANHRRFLDFLQQRLPADQAEDCLQAAYVRGLSRLDDLRDETRAVAWFYRLLRNAVVDRHRQEGIRARATAQVAAETESHFELELRATLCACLGELIDTLKPTYAVPLRRVELDEVPISTVAAELNLTPNALRVRLHRARKALAERLRQTCGTCTTHGCLDCSCRRAG